MYLHSRKCSNRQTKKGAIDYLVATFTPQTHQAPQDAGVHGGLQWALEVRVLHQASLLLEVG